MKRFLCMLLLFAAPACFVAQQDSTERVGGGAPSSLSGGPNLPAETVGPNDLLGISVYDSPELTRSVRVDSDGAIRLPMVKEPVPVAGLDPAALENAITKALVENNVLVDPLVTVSVLEYRSRPITVVGAVRTPTTFQADGTVTLLDAISRAGGIAQNAGPDILISRSASKVVDTGTPLTVRISVRSLIDTDDPAANIPLQGGDIIRVPQASQLYVVGAVKRPGAFDVSDASGMSVLKVLALCGGLDSYSKHTAFIYRVEAGRGGRTEIPVNVKSILDRKSADVALISNDILYVPDAAGRRLSARILATSLGVGLGVAALLLYVVQ